MSEPMNVRTKLILMNCAVAVALIYRWWKGAPLVVLAVTALIMFVCAAFVVAIDAPISIA